MWTDYPSYWIFSVVWTGSLLLDVLLARSQDKLQNKPALQQQEDFTVYAERLDKKRKPESYAEVIK